MFTLRRITQSVMFTHRHSVTSHIELLEIFYKLVLPHNIFLAFPTSALDHYITWSLRNYFTVQLCDPAGVNSMMPSVSFIRTQNRFFMLFDALSRKSEEHVTEILKVR